MEASNEEGSRQIVINVGGDENKGDASGCKLVWNVELVSCLEVPKKD
jgi:hypothetical protein